MTDYLPEAFEFVGFSLLTAFFIRILQKKDEIPRGFLCTPILFVSGYFTLALMIKIPFILATAYYRKIQSQLDWDKMQNDLEYLLMLATLGIPSMFVIFGIVIHYQVPQIIKLILEFKEANAERKIAYDDLDII